MMSNLVSLQKGWSIISILQTLIAEKKSKGQYKNSRNCFQSISLPCYLCKLGNNSGKSSGQKSIAGLLRHINNCHQPSDVDGKKLLDDYITLIDGLSIIINENPENYAIHIGVIRAMLNLGALYQ